MIAGFRVAEEENTPIKHRPLAQWLAILSSYCDCAEDEGIRFDAEVGIPDEIAIEEGDLSSFLLNMLDNAVGGCRGVARTDRFIRVKLRKKDQYLVVRCENAYDGRINRDAAGRPSTRRPTGSASGRWRSLPKNIAARSNRTPRIRCLRCKPRSG